MKEEVKNRLLTKLANASITKEEYRLLEIEALDDDFLFEAIQGYVQSDGKHEITDLQNKILVKAKDSSTPKAKTRSLWRYTSAAAAFLILISLGIWTYNFSSSSSSNSNETFVEQNTAKDHVNTQPKKSTTKAFKEVKRENPKTSEYTTPEFDEISESEDIDVVEKEEETEIQVQATSQYDEEGAFDVVVNEVKDRSLEEEMATIDDNLKEKNRAIPPVNSGAVADMDQMQSDEVKSKPMGSKAKPLAKKTQKTNSHKVFFKDEDGVSIQGEIINANTGQIIKVKSNNDGIQLLNKEQEFIFYNPEKGIQDKTIYKDQKEVQLTSFSWKRNSIYFPKAGWNKFYRMIDKHRSDAPSKGKVNLMIHINQEGNIELIEVQNSTTSELEEFTKSIISSQKDWIVLPNKSSFQFPLQIIW